MVHQINLCEAEKRFSHWWHAVLFLTSASKLNIETIGGSFDVSRQNDRASPNVKTLTPITHGLQARDDIASFALLSPTQATALAPIDFAHTLATPEGVFTLGDARSFLG